MDGTDANKRKYLKAVQSLYCSCDKVKGSPPNLDMPLREFLETYGWNGVAFCVLPEATEYLSEKEEAQAKADAHSRLARRK